jgi:predicted Rdx family selenoprotein
VRVAHPGIGGTFHIELDGVNVTGSMTVPDTGDWGVYRTIRKRGITVSAGQHSLKLVMDTANPTTGSVGNFNYVMFTKSAAFGGTPRAIPGQIQTEDFDINPFGGFGQGFAYHDTTPANAGGAYRVDEAVDIAPTDDGGLGFQVGWTERAEWLAYSVNISQSGAYEFRARVAHPGAGGTFHIEIDGQDVTGPIAIPDTGGWATWQTISKATTSLPAGQHVMYAVLDGESSVTGALANVNYFELLPATVTNFSAIHEPGQEAAFYVGVSYFDYNDVSEAIMRREFARFKQLGFSGVRLFPNWWNWHRGSQCVPNGDGAQAYAGDTVISHDGTIDEGAWQKLLRTLDLTREYELYVELAFSGENVAQCAETSDCEAPRSATDTPRQDSASLIFDTYKGKITATNPDGSVETDGKGILEIVKRFRQHEELVGLPIRGNIVVLDVQNEGDCDHTGPNYVKLTDPQIMQIIDEIRLVAPSRQGPNGRPRYRLTGSAACRFQALAGDTIRSGKRAVDTHQDIVTGHTGTKDGTGWDDEVAGWVADLHSANAAPGMEIYFSEHERWQPGRDFVKGQMLLDGPAE